MTLEEKLKHIPIWIEAVTVGKIAFHNNISQAFYFMEQFGMLLERKELPTLYYSFDQYLKEHGKTIKP